MARIGSFAPSTFAAGSPLNVIHPIDNVIPIFDPEIDALDLTDAEKFKLQQQADELSATLTLARDYKGE